jgi:hypothetical protein
MKRRISLQIRMGYQCPLVASIQKEFKLLNMANLSTPMDRRPAILVGLIQSRFRAWVILKGIQECREDR